MRTTAKLLLLVGPALFSSAAHAAAGKILLQVRPGYNPDAIVYEKQADVTINGKHVGGRFIISQDSGPAERWINLQPFAGDPALTVDATFTNLDGSEVVQCSRTWFVDAAGSIGCGPIEIYYQAAFGTCVLACN